MGKHILLVEDDSRSAVSLQRLLKSSGYEVAISTDGADGLQRAISQPFDAVITDLRMPGLGGLDLVRKLHAAKPDIPIVLMTAFGTTETAIEATKFGAFEYLVKPFEMPELLSVIARATARNSPVVPIVGLGEEVATGASIIGSSRVMRDLYIEIGRVASKPVTVLIRGETGTGKELVARALYQHSNRVGKPFVSVNCAAIPENLLESELFGHEKGAFTGADARREGRFEQADGGTIFLDEIGDMTPFTQAKLLRVLQEKTVQRLGGKDPIKVDVRVIAATHQDLEKLIVQGAFRGDLFYRLGAVVLNLPPLRQRTEDIPQLANYFIRRISSELELRPSVIESDALNWLARQAWPGNIRQLENVIRQALLATQGFSISVDHLRGTTALSQERSAGKAGSIEEEIEKMLFEARDGVDQDIHAIAIASLERRLFARAIDLAGGNQAKAARWLNVSRQTMRDKLTAFGLRTPEDRDT